jgi:hypothetical protein
MHYQKALQEKLAGPIYCTLHSELKIQKSSRLNRHDICSAAASQSLIGNASGEMSSNESLMRHDVPASICGKNASSPEIFGLLRDKYQRSCPARWIAVSQRPSCQ